jgi:hypothetical protein
MNEEDQGFKDLENYLQTQKNIATGVTSGWKDLSDAEILKIVDEHTVEDGSYTVWTNSFKVAKEVSQLLKEKNYGQGV